MKSLLASLSDHSIAMLRGIAELREITLATNVRADAAAQLAATLGETDAVEAALAACSPEARAAWTALRAAGGRMKVPVFARSYGQIHPIGPGKLERETAWRQPEDPAEELWYRGLIFRAFADLGDGPVEYVYIPDDLLSPAESPLTSGVGPPSPALAATETPARVQQAFNSLAVDICSLLAALRTTPARMDSAGRLRPADAARLQGGLLLQDAVRFDLMVALARERGWLVADHGKLATDTAASTAWLRGSHWEQTTALFLAWRDSADYGPGGKGWNDLWRIPSLQPEGGWRNDPLLARRAILAALRGLQPNAWYAVADLVGWVKGVNPDFQRPDGNYDVWYLRDAETGRYLAGFESWDQVEGRLIAFLIAGPLFWLGGVALGASLIGGAKVFRLTSAGVAWLAETVPVEMPRPARLAVSEDFTISAPLWLPLLDRFRLLRITEPVAGQYESGQATRHRITRGSLARARADGVKAEAVLEFLRRASGGRVPSRVAAGLARWDQHGGAVRVTKGAVLRVEDASTLATLRADPVVARLLGDLLSAQAVLISEANLPRLLVALEELGYTTRVE